MFNATTINLKGFAVGNGATNWDYDVSPSFPETVFNFNLIPRSIIDYFSTNDCVFYFNDFIPHTGPADCEIYWNKTVNLTSGLNWYDLYQQADVSPLSTEDRQGVSMVNGVEKKYKRGMTQKEYTPWIKNFKGEGQSVSNGFLSDYVNDADVRTALHIPEYAPAWDMCWDANFTYELQ
jgi:hypothetical protein